MPHNPGIAILILLLLTPHLICGKENVTQTIESLEQKLVTDPHNIYVMRELGLLYKSQSNVEKEIALGYRLLDEAPLSDNSDYANLYGNLFLGSAGAYEGLTPAVIYQYLEHALLFAERINDMEAQVIVLNSFALYYLHSRTDAYTALYYYFRALDLARANNDDRRCASIMSNIASCYVQRNDITGLKYAECPMRLGHSHLF